MMPFPFTPPTPEQAAQIEAYQQAVRDNQEAWRRVITGPYSFLWCTCRETIGGCPVHGCFLMTPDGEIL